MWKAFTTWKYGIFKIIAMVMFGVMAPLALAGLASALIILPMFLLGFSLEFWDNNSSDIASVSVLILGPFFIGNHWDQIQDFCAELESK